MTCPLVFHFFCSIQETSKRLNRSGPNLYGNSLDIKERFKKLSKKTLNSFCCWKEINNFEKRLAADVEKVRKKVRKKFYPKSQHTVSGKTQRNWVFVTNSDFVILISLHSNVGNFRYFKLWIILDQIMLVWNIKGLHNQVEKIWRL